jgi:hypothetical protein
MSQEFTQESLELSQESQEFAKAPTSTSGATGQACLKTGLYKATDGKIEFIEYYSVDDVFRHFPGGNGTKKCTWTKLSVASDGNKTGFTAVKVEAGAI